VPRLLPLVVALVLAAGPAFGGDRPAEDPDATVFLRAGRRGEPAPSKEAVGDLVVLSEVAEDDPWFAAVRALGVTAREVVPFRPDAPAKAFERLSVLRPGRVLVLIRPESLDVDVHFEILERASRLDDDPFVDFAFGYLTGASPEEAVRFAQGIAAARGKPFPRTILSFGPSSQAAPLGSEAPHGWARGMKERRLAHAEGATDVAEALAKVDGVGVYEAWGHGMPDRVSDGLTGAQIRASGLDLHPALYFSGPCYCGVTGRWFGWERGRMAEQKVAPRESFLLALLGARVTGAFAGLDPDRGETCHHELEHLLLTGEPLGLAAKTSYDDAALAYRRPELALPRHAGGGSPFRDIHDQMISGTACRALFGDPTLAPYEAAGDDPFRVETETTKDGLVVTWKGDGRTIGRWWGPVDVCRADGGWTHRLRFRFDVPAELAAKVRTFEVQSVTKDGKPLPFRYPTAAVERWGDVVRLHVLVVFPPDAKDRALWNGRSFEARLRFR
jgi:hypothetical protein